jgi:hypothetical protein
MLKDTIKVIAGALGLALYTTAIVSPPRPAVAADTLSKDDKDYITGALTEALTKAIKDPLANALRDANKPIVDAIRDLTAQQQHSVPVNCGEDCRPHHHHEPTKVLLVEKVVHVAPRRPHWCCRPPPPPPCPPGWGWY